MNTKQQFNSLSSRTSDLEKQIKTIQGGNSADWSAITNKPSTFPPSAHSHLISEVSNLQTTLDGKSNTGHTHAISDVSNLQTILNGKSDTTHTHAYSSLTSIPTSFTPSAHSHVATDVTQDSTHRFVTDTEKTTWNGKQAPATTLSGYGITDAYTKTQVDTSLAGKSDTGHTHAYSSLTGIPSTFTPSAHTHAEIGTLGNLTTTNKVDLVQAINEVNAKPTGSGGLPTTGGTMTGDIEFTSSKGTIFNTGTSKGRFFSLSGISDWIGWTLNAQYVSGSGWLLDDTTKNGWFLKLDSRAGGLAEFALYKIPSGAGYHTDEYAVFNIKASDDVIRGKNGVAVAMSDTVGTLSSLTTTNKTNLVSAINEVNAKPTGNTYNSFADLNNWIS
jgi:hypothetical protein